ncbi:hypothetical protein CYMTET_46195 [Cymbomonas tetramitiformis]|uniref:Uncharacterized protein n=1 Tax=Cymbomonas tetramitiformis TaxID=36881 RepID=A0AAE0BWN7_9CHLO|nr:hypothetical protein CYMTET_46195 [Cymbomonas tetramitiformis]
MPTRIVVKNKKNGAAAIAILEYWQEKVRRTQHGSDEEWERYFDKSDKFYIEIANEFGPTLADAVYEERVLCSEHSAMYPASKPWNVKDNCLLTPTQILGMMTSQLLEMRKRVKKRKIA